MTMSRHGVLLLLCAVLVQWHLTVATNNANLTPPPGFSLAFTALVGKGNQMYTCDDGVWSRTGSTAILLNSANQKIGTYKSVYNTTTRKFRMYWVVDNADGTTYETGAITSGVSAIPIYTTTVASGVPQYLAEVQSHQGAGDTSAVGYVALVQTLGGVAPSKSLCTRDGAATGIPFSGTFQFFTMDSEPPVVTPKSLIPPGVVVQGMFVKGRIVYKFDGVHKTWVQRGIIANIYDCVGGALLGKYGTITKADKYGSTLHWTFDNPNGFWLTGKSCSTAVKMSAVGCPWQLFSVTTSGGAAADVSLGPYKYVQMTSSDGGLPPLIAAAPGTTWYSQFSALMWLYT